MDNRYVGKFVKKSDRILPNPDEIYTNLFIKNLDVDISEEHLREKCSEFGKIISLVIAKDENGGSKGFGYVNFENPDDARRAVEAMNGSKLGRLRICLAVVLSNVNNSYNVQGSVYDLSALGRLQNIVCSKSTKENRA